MFWLNVLCWVDLAVFRFLEDFTDMGKEAWVAEHTVVGQGWDDVLLPECPVCAA